MKLLGFAQPLHPVFANARPKRSFTDADRESGERIEALTDELAAAAYDVLSADELDELLAGLEPIAAAM